jgi:hypothetical protein
MRMRENDLALLGELLDCAQSDRELCLQACGVVGLLTHRPGALPPDLKDTVLSVRSQLVACARRGEPPDWATLAAHLRPLLGAHLTRATGPRSGAAA